MDTKKIKLGGVYFTSDLSGASREEVVKHPRPRALTVRNKRTGEPMDIPTDSIPREIWPENWYENSYWMYNPDRPVLEPLIRRYLNNEELSEAEVKLLATYFLDHACHIAIMGYLFGGGPESLENNLPYIRRLRSLAASASAVEDLRTMVDVGMEYALDPF